MPRDLCSAWQPLILSFCPGTCASRGSLRFDAVPLGTSAARGAGVPRCTAPGVAPRSADRVQHRVKRHGCKPGKHPYVEVGRRHPRRGSLRLADGSGKHPYVEVGVAASDWRTGTSSARGSPRLAATPWGDLCSRPTSNCQCTWHEWASGTCAARDDSRRRARLPGLRLAQRVATAIATAHNETPFTTTTRLIVAGHGGLVV